MVIAHICDNIKTIEFYLGGGVFLLVVLESLLVGPDGSVLTRTNPVMMHSFSYPHGPWITHINWMKCAICKLYINKQFI